MSEDIDWTLSLILVSFKEKDPGLKQQGCQKQWLLVWVWQNTGGSNKMDDFGKGLPDVLERDLEERTKEL